MHYILNFIFGIKLYIFRTVPLSIVRSFSLYTRQCYMSYRFCCQLASRISKPVWHIPLLCVQWKTPDDGQRNCPKHTEFYSKNKFEKLVHLVGFIIRRKYFAIMYMDIPISHFPFRALQFNYYNLNQQMHTIVLVFE